MKLFIVMNYTAMEEIVLADRTEALRSDEQTELVHASSRGQYHNFTKERPSMFFSYKVEAEKHLKYLTTKYPHLAWGIFTLNSTQQADVPVKTTKV